MHKHNPDNADVSKSTALVKCSSKNLTEDQYRQWLDKEESLGDDGFLTQVLVEQMPKKIMTMETDMMHIFSKTEMKRRRNMRRRRMGDEE